MMTGPQKKHFLNLMMALGLAASLAACGGGGEEDYGPDEEESTEPDPIPNTGPVPLPTALKCDKGSYLTWNNFGSAYIRNYCISCHGVGVTGTARNGAPETVTLDSATDVQTWRVQILARTSGAAATMPPGITVPDLDKAMFQEWLDCGAPPL